MQVYHATPFLFDTLNPHSWISSSVEEACLHLFMKNIENGSDDKLHGYVITFSEVDEELLYDRIQIGDVVNALTMNSLMVSHACRKTLRETVRTLSPSHQRIFKSSVALDLKLFI